MSEHAKLITPISFGGDLRQAPTVATAAGPRTKMGDFLALTLTTSDSTGSVEINYRFLTDDGEILHGTQLMTFSGTGTQTAVVARLGDGWLQGFSVHRVSGTLTDGEVVAAVHLGRGEGSLARYECCLASGEITDVRSLGMGAYLIRGPAASTTTITPVNSTSTPAAGAEVSYTVTAGQTWFIQALHFRLVTDATVATRYVDVRFDDGTNRIVLFEATTGQAASLTYYYTWSNTGSVYAPTANAVYMIPMPPMYLSAGCRIRTETTGLKAGDQFSQVMLSYLQY